MRLWGFCLEFLIHNYWGPGLLLCLTHSFHCHRHWFPTRAAVEACCQNSYSYSQPGFLPHPGGLGFARQPPSLDSCSLIMNTQAKTKNHSERKHSGLFVLTELCFCETECNWPQFLTSLWSLQTKSSSIILFIYLFNLYSFIWETKKNLPSIGSLLKCLQHLKAGTSQSQEFRSGLLYR